ncbi:hypothetical protein EDD11_003419 [Mortierella claussenii]|nr:hypothetical protein EDD11_003419 [Mortierella claussenii]
MGFWFGFLCGLLFLPLSILAGVYYFFTYSRSYSETRQQQQREEQQREKEQNELDLEYDMPSALYASYMSLRQQLQGGSYNNINVNNPNTTNGSSYNTSSILGASNNGSPRMGLIPEHLDPQYQFAGWISVKRIPEVDHRIIEPSIKKETKKRDNNSSKNSGSANNRKGTGGLLDEMGALGMQGRGVTGSIGAGAAAQDPRFTYLDTQNPHLSLPPCLQARFKDSKYGVIKGATMFIYENEHMAECLGVITLPHYQVSVPGQQKDSHIFSKRNPIWLKYQPSSHHARQSTSSSDSSLSSSKDYYLSMVNSVDKEDLYFTLLRCSKLKPNSSRSFLREIPKRDSTLFDKPAMNKLIQTIHSNEHQFQAAWLNAILGRIFLGVYKTPQIKDMVFQKMVDKLSRVRLPNFLNDMRMKSVHLGDGVPLITRPKLLTLKPNGDMIMDMNLLYQGGFRAEVEAEAVVTVTKKIQPIKVSLVLVMTLIRLEGRVQAWIKPPPCNRIWYGFYHKPQVEMKIEPVVSDKHIKSNLIIKAIENKMLEAIAETMVLPNMDDVPFSDSEGIGGIFGEEILPGGETAPAASSSATSATGHHGSKMHHTIPVPQPKWPHSPGPRSATINLTESAASTPRSAIELPSDLRHRTETMSIPELYQNASSARSHSSLGDELMQTNLTYDSQNKSLNMTDDDPMRSGIHRSAAQSSVESGEGHPARTLHVPGGRGIKVGSEQVPKSNSSDNVAINNGNSSSSTHRLLHRKTPGISIASNATEPVRSRRGSLDPALPLSYTTGSSAGMNTPSSAHFPGTESVRTMEDHWSQYGISEYEPSIPEGGKMNPKDKKKMKEKLKNNHNAAGGDVDKMSVHSKDSGDTTSTHTGNTHWTENTAGSSTLFGNSNSSHSTIDSSLPKDKFSLSRMFQGFRKKHTKGAHSGSGLQPPHSGSTLEDVEADSMLLEDEEGEAQDTESNVNGGGSPYGPVGLSPSTPMSSTLQGSFSPQQRKKFESTPNLSSAMYSEDQQEQPQQHHMEMQVSSVSDKGILPPSSGGNRSLHEEYEFLPVRREGSPVPSVYAASLFNVDDPHHNHPNSARGIPSPGTQHPNHSLMSISSAFRKLRNRSHGGSGSSKEELSIPHGDLNTVLGQQKQQQGLLESENSSQLSVQTDGYDSNSTSHGPYSTDSVLPRRSGESGSTIEDEPFSRGTNEHSAFRLQPDPLYTTRIRNARATSGNAPTIVLQRPSPNLGHTEPSSPMHAEDSFGMDGPQGRVSMDDGRLPQGQGNTRSNSVNGKLGAATITRPRRHSINHPPSSVSPVGYPATQMHPTYMHLHGLGVSPASPLRKEFSRDDIDAASNFNPTIVELESESSSSSSNSSTTGERTRNNSDSFSMTSSTASSSQSNTPKEPPQHHHLHLGGHDHQPHRSSSSTFRNILSSLGNKHRRKNSNASATTSYGPHLNHQSSSPDPYSTVGIVGMVGLVAMDRASASTPHLDSGDPYAYAGGGVDEYSPPSSTISTPTATSASATPQQQQRSSQESSRSLPLRSEAVKMEAGLAPLLESKFCPPTQSIMGKAVALDIDHRKEALHARPGYIGEYPTPVRMHSMLNREAAAVRKHIGTDLSSRRRSKNQGATAVAGWDGADVVDGSDQEQKQQQQQEEEDNDEEESLLGSASPPSDVSLSSGAPRDLESSPVKYNSLPPPKMDTTLPEPLPLAYNGESIPMGTPILPREEEKEQEKVVVKEYKSLLVGPPDSPHSEQSSSSSSSSALESTESIQQQRPFSSMSDGANQTMTWCENSNTTKKNTQLSLNPRIEEPLREHDQEQQQHHYYLANMDGHDDENFEDEDGRFLQPSDPTSWPASPTNSKKNGNRSNIFKRLIRRKSEDSLNMHHRQQAKSVSNLASESGSSLYMSPGLSQSQTSIMSVSTTSSSKSMPFFHRHHRKHQQQQQQPQQDPGLEPLHPHEHEYQEYPSTQIPDRPPEQLRQQQLFPEGTSFGRVRNQSTEGPTNPDGTDASATGVSGGGGLLARVRSRPRSSTIHAMSPMAPDSRRM